MNFVGDLTFGQKWEAMARLLMSATEDIQEVAPAGQFKAWDFRTHLWKYEVKADRLAHKYGCKTMFIEVECSGKPSGITTTEAEYWIYFMVKPNADYVAYRIPTATLRERVGKSPVKAGGDGYRSRGAIVSVDGLDAFKMKPYTPLQRSLKIRLPSQSLGPSGNTSPAGSCSDEECPRPPVPCPKCQS